MMTSKRVTSQDVARAAGVSRTTVSMVLNNVTSIKISQQTRQLVLDTALQLGYVPNAAARALASDRSHIIGLVMARQSHHIVTDAFLNLILDGLLKSIHRHSMRLMIEIVEPKHQQETYLHMARAKHIDGLILAGVRQDDEGIYALMKEGIPAVLIGSMSEALIDTVDVDNRRASRDAVEHLIGLGHTRIACVTNASLDYFAPAQRLDGYRTALEAAGLPYDADLVRSGDYTLQSGYTQMNSLLDSRARFSAVFIASDVVAQGAFAAIQERGLNIPRDIAIIGFDDVPLARFLVPSLTTIHVPAQEMAEQACEILIKKIAKMNGVLQNIFLPTELVVRESCGAKQKHPNP
jgi:LacI family transcriptional regulator